MGTFACAFVFVTLMSRVGTIIINNVSGDSNRSLCRNGWRTVGMAGQTKCIKIMKQAKSWSEASHLCHREVGALLNSHVDIILQPEQSLLDLTSEDGSYPLYWSGLHMNNETSHRLSWDGLPPRRFEEINQRRWDWARGHPSDAGNCVAVQFLPRTPDYNYYSEGEYSDFPLFQYSVNASLVRCEEKKFYICQADQVEPDIYLSSGCKDGWISNKETTNCYRVFNEKLKNFRGAQKQCTSVGGMLADYSPGFNQEMLLMVANWFKTNDGYFLNNDFHTWLTNSDGASCIQLVYHRNNSTWSFLDNGCSAEMSFVCKMTKELSDLSPLDLSIRTEDREPLPFLTLPPVTCQISRQLSEVEEVYLYRNGELINTNRYEESATAQSSIQVNITFQEWNPELYIPDIADIGFYWCSVLTKFPYQITHSTRTLVRFDYGDIMVFQGTATLNSEIQKLDYLDFNLYGLSQFQEAGVIFDVQNNLDQYFTESTNNYIRESSQINFGIRSSVVILNHFRNGSVVDFMLHVILQSRLINVSVSEPVLLSAYQDAVSSFSFNSRVKRQTSGQIRSIALRSTVYCYSKTVDNGLVLQQTLIGQQGGSEQICIKDNIPLASAKCEGDYYTGAYWGPETIKQECIPTDLETSDYSATLEALSKLTITPNNVENVTQNLANLTADSGKLKPVDLIYTAEILKNTAKMEGFYQQTVEEVLNTVDNILEVPQSVVDDARKHGSAPTRIVEALEEISEKVYLRDGQNMKIVRDNVATQVWKGSRGQLGVIGLKLNSNHSALLTDDSLITLIDETDVTYPTLDLALVLPREILTGNDVKLVMHIYNTDKFFRTPSGKSQQYSANSKVIAAKLLKKGNVITDLGTFNMTSVYLPNQEQEEPTCGYWNYSGMNSAGAWSMEGCYFDGYVDGRAVCICNHLTNFAILLDFYGNDKLPDAHKEALHIITMVGVCLSMAGLALTVLSFILLKPLRKGRAQQTLFNLALSMLCSLIVFITGISEIGDRSGCIAVAALLHYFILVSFMWMLMEAILQYLRFVKVLGTYIPNFMWKTAIPSWGLPIIPVAVVCGIDYNLYYGGYDYCWMSLNPFYYAFALPLGLIIVVNLIVFLMVIANLCRPQKGLRSNQSERQRQVRNFQAAVTVFILLGLTWIFGYLAIEDAKIVFKYIFCIVGSLQGFFIFLFFTARERQVRKSLAQALCCGTDEKAKAAYNSRTNDSSTPNSKERSGSTTNTSLTDVDVSISNSRKGLGN